MHPMLKTILSLMVVGGGLSNPETRPAVTPKHSNKRLSATDRDNKIRAAARNARKGEFRCRQMRCTTHTCYFPGMVGQTMYHHQADFDARR